MTETTQSPHSRQMYVLSGSMIADIAHQALTDLSHLQWPLGRSSLYRMAYQGITPSASKLVKFLDVYAETGLDPMYPAKANNPAEAFGAPHTSWRLWDKVAEALTEFWARTSVRFDVDPILCEMMDRWVPVLLAKPELREKVTYPLSHIYPTYEELHEMGAWNRSVSPYDLLAPTTPKWLNGFTQFIMEKYSDKFKQDPSARNQLGAWRKAAAPTSLYAMKAQHIGKATYQNNGQNLYPHKVLLTKAAKLASVALGSSGNLNWEYAIANQKAKTLPDDLYQFGRFDIDALRQDFEARLRSGPFPCTIQATFTPELNRRHEEARKYRASFTPEFGMVDEIKLNDLFCYSIASEITLKWTDTQLLSLALYYHVPLHCLLLWVMEAAVVYRRRFATDHTVMAVKRNVCDSCNISLAVYNAEFYDPYNQFVQRLSSSKSSRYHEMKRVADKLLNIDHAKVESGEEPVEELEAFYELILGAPNGYATNPLSDKEIRRIESRTDPDVVRPTDLYGDDEDDDDEPAVSLLDVLAEDDDFASDDEEEFTFDQPAGRFRLPSVEEYKALGDQPRTKFVQPSDSKETEEEAE